MNSSPPSVGESTLLCRCTFGRPGISAEHDLLDARLRRGGDRDGVAVAAHALRGPEDVHLVYADLPLPRQPPLPSFDLSTRCVDEQLLARRHVHVEPAALAAVRGERAQLRLGRARAAAHAAPAPPRSRARRPRAPSLRYQLERELERRRAPPGAGGRPSRSTSAHAAPVRVPARDRHDCVGDRELVHQQILGSGSPTSWSITRLPPNAVSTSTMPGRLRAHLADLGGLLAAGHGAQRGERGVGRFGRHERDELALVRDVHRVDAEDLGRARYRGLARARPPRARSSPRRDARASSLSTDATPPRVASRMQRSAGPAASSSASTAGQSERVSDSIVGLELELPAREHDRRAVVADLAGDEDRGRPASARPGTARARSSTRPMPLVHTYIWSA